MLWIRKLATRIFGITPLTSRVYTCVKCRALCNSLWDLEDHDYTYHDKDNPDREDITPL